MRAIDVNRWNFLLGRDKSARHVVSGAGDMWVGLLFNDEGLLAIQTPRGFWEAE